MQELRGMLPSFLQDVPQPFAASSAKSRRGENEEDSRSPSGDFLRSEGEGKAVVREYESQEETCSNSEEDVFLSRPSHLWIRTTAETVTASWNNNGVFREKAELENFLQDQDVPVMLFSKTHLKKGQSISISYLP